MCIIVHCCRCSALLLLVNSPSCLAYCCLQKMLDPLICWAQATIDSVSMQMGHERWPTLNVQIYAQRNLWIWIWIWIRRHCTIQPSTWNPQHHGIVVAVALSCHHVDAPLLCCCVVFVLLHCCVAAWSHCHVAAPSCCCVSWCKHKIKWKNQRNDPRPCRDAARENSLLPRQRTQWQLECGGLSYHLWCWRVEVQNIWVCLASDPVTWDSLVLLLPCQLPAHHQHPWSVLTPS